MSQLSKHQYTIDTENKDPKASIISKSNVDVKFTIYELEANFLQMQKMVKQLSAQKQLADAKMKNIEENHPFVLDLDEEKAFTVHMYQEARSMSRVCGSKLPEYEEEIAYIQAELAEINSQIGIAIPKTELEAPMDSAVAPTAIDRTTGGTSDVKPGESTNKDEKNA